MGGCLNFVAEFCQWTSSGAPRYCAPKFFWRRARYGDVTIYSQPRSDGLEMFEGAVPLQRGLIELITLS